MDVVQPAVRATDDHASAVVSAADRGFVLLMMAAIGPRSHGAPRPAGPAHMHPCSASRGSSSPWWVLRFASLAAAAHARRRAAAAAAVGIGAVFLYLLHFAAAAWPPARPYARLSPFHYYEAMRTLLGLHDARPDVLTLFAATAVLLALAYAIYARRDL